MSYMYIQAPHLNDGQTDVKWHDWARRDTRNVNDKWLNSRITNLSKKYPNTVFRIYFYDRWTIGKNKNVYRYFKNGVEIPEPTFTLLVKVSKGYVRNGEVKSYGEHVTVEDGDEYFAWLLMKGVRSYSSYAFEYVEYDGKRRAYHNIGRNQTVEASWSEVEEHLHRIVEQKVKDINALVNKRSMSVANIHVLTDRQLEEICSVEDLSGLVSVLNKIALQIEGVAIYSDKDEYKDKLWQVNERLKELAEWVENG